MVFQPKSIRMSVGLAINILITEQKGKRYEKN